MMIHNMTAAALLSAVLVGPMALIGVYLTRRDKEHLNSWKISLGLVEKVEPFSGETNFDILTILYFYDGEEYLSNYDNNKHYDLARGDVTAIIINPENPSKIKIVRPGDAKTLSFFIDFCYFMFFIFIFIDYNYVRPSS